MAPPSNSREERALHRELLLQETCRASYFSRMQRIYDNSRSIGDAQARENFISATETIDDIRDKYLKCLHNINSIQMEMNETFTPDFNSWSGFEDLYCAVKRVKNQLNPPTAASTNKASAHECLGKRSFPKLGPIEIPEFDGNPNHWSMFYASFKKNIHLNFELDNSEKLYYLVGKLKGKAQSIISGVSPNESNYESIWESLVKKYEDKRFLATTLLDTIFDIKPLPNPASATQLESFVDKYAVSIAALKDLELPNLCDYIFIYLGLKRLDKETSKAFEMSVREVDIPTYKNFIDFIQCQVKIVQRTNQAASPRVLVKDSEHPKKPHIPKISHTYFTANSSATFNNSCTLCNKQHELIYDCKVFMNLTPDDKYNFIKQCGFCTNCLSSKHKWNSCQSKKLCRSCGLKHHSLLHLEKSNNTGSSSTMNRGPPRRVTSQQCYSSNVTPHAAPPAAPTSPQCNNSQQSLVSVTHTSPPPQDTVTHLAPAPAPISYSDANTGGLSYLSADANIADRAASQTKTKAHVPYTNVLLGTAYINVYNRFKQPISCRCIIDPGSQNHFITSDCCRKLGLTIEQLHRKTIIKGLGDHSNIAKGKVKIVFSSSTSPDKVYALEPLVLNHITERLPTASVDIKSLEYLKNLPLADKEFYKSSPIDILIGAKLFIDLLLPGKVTGLPNQPSAFLTTLGYVVMGEVEVSMEPEDSVSYLATAGSIHDDLSRFFELNDVKEDHILSPQEKACEEFYTATTARDASGRFIVGLPFQDSPDRLGDSLTTARNQFLSLERKFKNKPAFKARYDEIIREYLEKGYLIEISEPKNNSEGFTLPHHGVLREDKLTSKLRIVLNGSAATTSGTSLNDILHVGPPLQTDLFNILLNFRLFEVAVTADIRQMFLRLLVREEDQPYQQIIYRFNPREPLRYFAFQRVCFGLRSSPYLAIRTIHELSKQENHNFPEASRLALRDLYVDDIASSFQNTDTAVTAVHQLIEMFSLGGFELVKWSSNSRELLSHVPETHRLTDPVDLDKDESLKILGMQWLPITDVFAFTIAPSDRVCTKRKILSTVARLWDIMGLVGPVIVLAKLLIKELWASNLDWDDTPPDHIIKTWSQFQSELPLLSHIKIPRHLHVFEHSEVTLLGFCDASERAFGAVVYLHVNNDNVFSTTLVCSKSKVSPGKSHVTLARLELCAALLLAKLLRSVMDNYSPRFTIKNIYAFSDSTVALHWIHSPPHRFQTFVANRVSKIQSLLPAKHYHHIPGVDNPSDCLSRGLMPSKLLDHPLWFNGPAFAFSDEKTWPITPFKPDSSEDVPEMKSISLASTGLVEQAPLLCQLASRCSTWNKLVRIVVHIYRFLKLLPRSDVITANDLDFAENKILCALQKNHFRDEFKLLASGKTCAKYIQKLAPFVLNGLIRVGGRLINTQLSYDHRHPILLPRKDCIVDLIIDHYHRHNCHAGPNLLFSLLRHKYWIITGRRTIRTRISKCNSCFRTRPKPTYPIMGDLPDTRTHVVPKPFTYTGCDFGGPLSVTLKRGRGVRSQKAYICLFICLTTRAIHIEVASDLSTATFISAFKRFLSRRGPVSVMHSDNATNFVGAKGYLNDIYKFVTSSSFRSSLAYELSDYKIEWKTTPPNAPHFGSWEPLIKTVKSHLYRAVGSQILTLEELNTVLCEIENVVNSRPLCTTLSQDPGEPLALTPSHFLTLTPLKFLPAASVSDEPTHLLERYQLLDKLVQSFWDRWSLEYLNTLQARAKWYVHGSTMQIGTVVVIIPDGKVPPLQWELGIVTEIHPGRDDVTRVATVRTSRGYFKRPVVRLCSLPSQ